MKKTKEEILKEKGKLIEFLRTNPIEGSFKVEGGLCHDFNKCVETTICQLENYEFMSVYWKSAYTRLWKIKKTIKNN